MKTNGDDLTVEIANKRVTISVCASEIGRILKLVLVSKDAVASPIERFTDDGITFRYKVFDSPETRIERDPQTVDVLLQAMSEWQKGRPGK